MEKEIILKIAREWKDKGTVKLSRETKYAKGTINAILARLRKEDIKIVEIKKNKATSEENIVEAIKELKADEYSKNDLKQTLQNMKKV